MMNALLTPQKPLNLKKVKVFRFIDGTTIIANLVRSSDTLISLSGPVSLKEMRNAQNGAIEGFLTEPYMAPYASFNPDKVVVFNGNHLLCSDTPSDMLMSNYMNIIKAALKAEINAEEDIPGEVEKLPGEDPIEPTKELIH